MAGGQLGPSTLLPREPADTSMRSQGHRSSLSLSAPAPAAGGSCHLSWGWGPAVRPSSLDVTVHTAHHMGWQDLSLTAKRKMGRFGSVFPSLNMAVKRREQALQDYRRLQAKVEKYEEKEKTGPVLAKLHQAREELRPVQEDFEAKNKQLLDEMPRFYGSRLDYFQPSFESLIRAQVVYYSEMHKIFGDLTQQLDQPGHSDEQRERENEAKLSELRALSIVADD
ncbi:bridging integrator 3 isoform X2 [Heterocephalus glaber]|uniref:Bridging integrator 3 n=1 Tax=Heterocephalus glaber TaxID=10181 RepID=A0AAX6PC46_HETGA|nr:bridging integrator 3 isoform X2 [Heterocephalus glaber]